MLYEKKYQMLIICGNVVGRTATKNTKCWLIINWLLMLIICVQDGNKGMTLEARKQRDAEMMRVKQQKANEAKK